MMDVSQLTQFIGPDLFIAAVFDAFSRVPLLVQVFEDKPGAKDMARLLMCAARAFAQPRYVITDLGGEFTGRAFARAIAQVSAVQRFASSDSILATARLERFWRTLKEAAHLYRLQLPLTAHDLEHRLELALLYYVAFRPHEGLDGATPLETFLGLEPAHLAAVEPPRGRPGESSADPPFQIAYLDPGNRGFPVLKPAA
jgi:transposase InsO family protein